MQQAVGPAGPVGISALLAHATQCLDAGRPAAAIVALQEATRVNDIPGLSHNCIEPVELWLRRENHALDRFAMLAKLARSQNSRSRRALGVDTVAFGAATPRLHRPAGLQWKPERGAEVSALYKPVNARKSSLTGARVRAYCG